VVGLLAQRIEQGLTRAKTTQYPVFHEAGSAGGEDGPSHRPCRTLASFRRLAHLDREETGWVFVGPDDQMRTTADHGAVTH
jgi:hypothetical protein